MTVTRIQKPTWQQVQVIKICFMIPFRVINPIGPPGILLLTMIQNSIVQNLKLNHDLVVDQVDGH